MAVVLPLFMGQPNVSAFYVSLSERLTANVMALPPGR